MPAKSIYGMVKSALLFYRKLIKELKEMGFEINPFDPCVANKIVDGTQMTVRWHIDDLMISHGCQSIQDTEVCEAHQGHLW